jgi:hypothetical protein
MFCSELRIYSNVSALSFRVLSFFATISLGYNVATFYIILFLYYKIVENLLLSQVHLLYCSRQCQIQVQTHGSHGLFLTCEK